MGLKAEIAREVCRRFPKSPTLTLAKKLAKEHVAVFDDVENARNAIRYVRGETGDRSRKKIARNPVEVLKGIDAIPDSDAKPYLPYVLKATGKGLVWSDHHVPYHSPDAIKSTLRHCRATKHNDFCIILGDFLDCYQLSHWDRDPRRRNFAGELKVAGQILDILAGEFGKIVYKSGNHEYRYERYMLLKAPELLDLPGMELPDLLGLADRKIEYVEQMRVMHAGQLNLLHGHEYKYGATNPVNPARGMFIRAHSCTVSGHLHQTSHHNEPDIRGTLTSNWSLGCQCDLSPAYSPLNKWCHGFALMDFDGKNFEIVNKRIVQGQVV